MYPASSLESMKSLLTSLDLVDKMALCRMLIEVAHVVFPKRPQ